MTIAVVNHLWQSTVVAIVAALVALALRRTQARVRHAVWLAASMKFLVPFSVLIALGGAVSWRAATAPVVSVAPAIAETVQTMTEPFADATAAAGPIDLSRRPVSVPWATVLVTIWTLGAVGVIASRVRGWLRVRAALRASTATTLSATEHGLDVRTTSSMFEPGVVGIWRPVLLLPEGLGSTLIDDQLRAIIAHELHHVRRRDNLTSGLHMIVEAAFWFHPVVWWIGARLIDERERACDEHVIAIGVAPDAYAEGILNVCKRYVESPVACVAGVTGADLKKRIGAILTRRVGVQLTGAHRLLLGTAGIAALSIPVLAGAIGSPRQAAPSTAARFDAASVRPCAIGPNAEHGRGQKIDISKNRLYLECFELDSLVHLAYVTAGQFALGQRGVDQDVRGGPAWIHTERYTIDAVAAGDPGNALAGSMLQAFLEDRFELRVHRVPEQVPMYGLTVAKSGLKIAPLPDGACVEFKDDDPPNAPGKDGRPFCGSQTGRSRGAIRVWDLQGVSLKSLADILETDRQVVDQTGISDLFNIHLEYTPDSALRSAGGAPADRTGAGAADVSTAIEEQLGLKFVPTTGAHEYVLVDHVVRPSQPPQQTASTIPRFDVVSVRPCERGAPSQGRGSGGPPITAPGHLYLQCYPLSTMFEEAYVFFAGGRAHALGFVMTVGVEGGPDWMKSDRYTIEAKTDRDPSPAVMRGPMLQAILEDRFKLKVRRETRELPIYELVIAKSGGKVTPYSGRDCVVRDDVAWPPPTLPEGQRYCGDQVKIDGDRILRAGVETLDQFAALLPLDRPVVNKTGITAPVSFRLEYAKENQPAGDAPPSAAWVRALRDQLGLELHTSKGPRDFLVIDHAERPTPDTSGGGK